VSVVAAIVREVLAEIAPLVAQDGGVIEFVSYDDGIVTVRLGGACATCPISLMTLRFGIEDRVRERVPELKAVRAVV
jgi:Fe-S cluster biogenesis protein NfuA